MQNGDSFPDGTANVAVEAGKGAISTGVGAAGAELVAAGAGAAGATGVAAAAAPIVAVVVIGGVTYYVLDKTDEGLEIKKNVAEATDNAMTAAADTYVKTEDYVVTNAPVVEEAVKDKALAMADTTDMVLSDAKEFWTDVMNSEEAENVLYVLNNPSPAYVIDDDGKLHTPDYLFHDRFINDPLLYKSASR